MFKKALSLILAMITLISVISITTFTASAEENKVVSATADEASTDEVKLVVSDEPNVDPIEIKGTVIGMIGDTNKDNKVNIKDSTYIQKYLARFTYMGESSKLLGDVDGNSKLNVRDATTIQKYIAGIEVDTKICHVLFQTGKHTHEFVESVFEATCTKDGYTAFSCICGEEKTENVVNATGHNYTIKVISPNCIEGGYTEHICKNCQHSYKDQFTNATGVHNFDSGKCKSCGHTNQKFLVNAVVDYVIENGEYVKEENLYLFEVEPFFDYEYAFLTAQKGVNVFVYTFMVNFEDGYDIVSLAFSEEKEEVEYYMVCSGYFESAGYWKMGEFTADVSDSEFYFYVDGISKEEALEYTMEHIYLAAEVLFMGESLPESIRYLVW